MSNRIKLPPTLGSIRISLFTDETTAPERQRADLLTEPVNYVYMAEDLDVSAYRYSPFEREDLGPWLTDPEKIAQYDRINVWKLDRFCRSARDMREMLLWADEHGKVLYFQQDGLTYDPHATKGFAKILNDMFISLVAGFAEMESLNTSTRIKSLHAYLRENKYWKGGHVPFGYEPVKKGKHKILSPSQKTQPKFLDIADRIIDGENTNFIADDLNQKNELTPRDWSRVFHGKQPIGQRWNAHSIETMFESDFALGWLTRADIDSKWGTRYTVRDEDGNPIQQWEPIIDREKLLFVRAKLAERIRQHNPYSERTQNPLLDIVKCPDCGHNLAQLRKNDKLFVRCYRAYRKDHDCDNRSIVPIELAWQILEDYFVDRLGNKKVVEGKYVKTDPNAAKQADLIDQWSAVSLQAQKATSQAARERLQTRLDALDAELAALEQQPAGSGRWEETELAETYAEKWARSDLAERRLMIIKSGATLRIKRDHELGGYFSEVVHNNEIPETDVSAAELNRRIADGTIDD
jgi:site-specific DNA recombinase